MTFNDWWATLTTREQARMVKEDVAEAWEAATLIEREACAKVCDDRYAECLEPEARELAESIRMRSNVRVQAAAEGGRACNDLLGAVATTEKGNGE